YQILLWKQDRLWVPLEKGLVVTHSHVHADASPTACAHAEVSGEHLRVSASQHCTQRNPFWKSSPMHPAQRSTLAARRCFPRVASSVQRNRPLTKTINRLSEALQVTSAKVLSRTSNR